jgi:hypothetical protein
LIGEGALAKLSAMKPGNAPHVWRTPEGKAVSCLEKLKVMNGNVDEIRQMCQDALEDGILMGCDEAQIRQVLHEIVDALQNPYAGRRGGRI